MDRSYKEDIPALRKVLESLTEQCSDLNTRTDWLNLRMVPLLQHARTLEKLMLSPQFKRETHRLTKGVAMFHSDLVYLRENVKALKAVVKAETYSKAGVSIKARETRTDHKK
jgi:hypothetical protein